MKDQQPSTKEKTMNAVRLSATCPSCGKVGHLPAGMGQWPKNVRCKQCKTIFNPEESDSDLLEPVMDSVAQDKPAEPKPATKRKTHPVIRFIGFSVCGLFGLLASLIVLGMIVGPQEPSATSVTLAPSVTSKPSKPWRSSKLKGSMKYKMGHAAGVSAESSGSQRSGQSVGMGLGLLGQDLKEFTEGYIAGRVDAQMEMRGYKH
jgi:hypothetical protein